MILMRAIKRIPKKLGAVGTGIGLLAAVLLQRALRLPSRQKDVTSAPAPDLDAEALAGRLSGAIRFPTISKEDPQDVDDAPFRDFRGYVEQTYPRLHAALTRELIADRTLLYTWPGSDPALDPVLLLAHQDVVPVDPGTEETWEQPPFSGNVVDGYIWGRGSLDNKQNLIGLLEAAEHLVEAGFQPRRTVLLAFGHDEEVGGQQGAVAVVRLLSERGTHPAFVLDEGGVMVEGMVPGVSGPVAVVGVAEKGYVSVELLVETAGGHSSTPPRESSISILADAVRRLESSPLPARLEASVRGLFEALAPEARFGHRLVFANLWLFETLVTRLLERVPETAAMVRTTTAPTMFQAGVKDNVVPGRARAVVNFRILTGETIQSVLDHVRRIVVDDRVQVSALTKQREPSAVSPADSEQFALIERTIREVFPDTVVAPYLVLAATDARHFQDLTEHVYRFMPFLLSRDDLKGIHGTNERVSVEAFVKAVDFYVRLVRNAAG
jgi:carboxypeptidase PM20D1